MTNTPHHAADDGALARSTGGAAARGALLIALAVIIGLVLLAFALDDSPARVATDESPTSTQPEDDGDGSTSDTTPGDDGVTDTSSTTSAAPATIPEADPGEPRDPAEVNVLVANGTGGIQGVAGRVSDKLKARGYIAEASNAPATPNSVIYYREGYEDDARAVAEIVGTTPDVIDAAPEAIAINADAIEDGRLDAANVVVIVGSDEKIPTG